MTRRNPSQTSRTTQSTAKKVSKPHLGTRFINSFINSLAISPFSPQIRDFKVLPVLPSSGKLGPCSAFAPRRKASDTNIQTPWRHQGPSNSFAIHRLRTFVKASFLKILEESCSITFFPNPRHLPRRSCLLLHPWKQAPAMVLTLRKQRHVDAF